MSELQLSLLVIGAAVVAAVYGYGAWQQRQYRRRFGSAFSQPQADALYAARSGDGTKEVTAGLAAGQAACSTLDEDFDYIVELTLPGPMRASVLAPLWQQRFDFGKSVTVCGRTGEGQPWERVVAEGLPTYIAFRLSLQLVDRGGPVSESQLAGFSELVGQIAHSIKAEAVLPDVAEAARHAQELDEFCAEVDQMMGLNILPGGNDLLLGRHVALVAERYGMVIQPDGAFHLLDDRGRTLFTLSNFDNTPFSRHELDQIEVVGLAMQLDVPRVEQPTNSFDALMQLAYEVGRELQAEVVDDYRAPLNDGGVNMIRNQIAEIERKLLSRSIVPGSAKAYRLFS